MREVVLFLLFGSFAYINKSVDLILICDMLIRMHLIRYRRVANLSIHVKILSPLCFLLEATYISMYFINIGIGTWEQCAVICLCWVVEFVLFLHYLVMTNTCRRCASKCWNDYPNRDPMFGDLHSLDQDQLQHSYDELVSSYNERV